MKKKIFYSKSREYLNTECWKFSGDNVSVFDPIFEKMDDSYKSRSGEYWFLPAVRPISDIAAIVGDVAYLIPEGSVPQTEKAKKNDAVFHIRKNIRSALPVLIPVLIAAAVFLAIFFTEIVFKIFFSCVMAAALAVPLVVSILNNKQIFSAFKIVA